MEITQATEQELEELISFYRRTADDMEERGIRYEFFSWLS